MVWRIGELTLGKGACPEKEYLGQSLSGSGVTLFVSDHQTVPKEAEARRS